MKKLTKLLILVLSFLLTVNYLLLTAEAAVPHLINYQGRLTDKDAKPLEGAYNLTFRIYDAENAGNLLWQETHSGVVIQKGVFSVLLGSINSLDNLPFDRQYFLEIKVGEEVMSPRQIIASAAYAIAGVPRGIVVMWSGTIGDIPKGWALCDGTNGAPDLRDKFIVGARKDDGGVAKTNLTGSLTQSGGSTTLSEVNLPSHTHAAGTLAADNESAHTHGTTLMSVGGGIVLQNGSGFAYSSGNSGAGSAHTHTLSGSTGAIGSGTAYTQPYYALAYIMRL